MFVVLSLCFGSVLYSAKDIAVDIAINFSISLSKLCKYFLVFVMTAADPRESSYACYFDNLRGTYLGDVFSVKWMENSDVVSNLF